MATMPVEIIAVGQEHAGLGAIAGLLNTIQDAFSFSVERDNALITLLPAGNNFVTSEVYSALREFKARRRGYHPHLIAVVNRRIDGTRFGNLLGGMEETSGELTGLAVTSTHCTDTFLGGLPDDLFLTFEFISFALRFLNGKGLIHDESRQCVFDVKINKSEVTTAIRSGTLCSSCREKLSAKMNSDQELAIERCFRLLREIAESPVPAEALGFRISAAAGATPKVFLCHSSRDKEFVRRLARDLIESGCRVWFDDWEISIGDNIVERISAGLADSGYLIVVLSPKAVQSAWVRQEWTSMFMRLVGSRDSQILPVLVEDCSVPQLLSAYRYADFRTAEKYDDSYKELLRTLQQKKM